MPSGIVLSVDIKARIIADYKKGLRQADIARKYSLLRATVSQIIKKFILRGHVIPLKKSGRPRKTTPRIDELILRKARQDPFTTSKEIK